MQFRTLAGVASFSIQIASGAAVTIWPEAKLIGWGIFGVATVGLLVSLGGWFFVNYKFRWPVVSRAVKTEPAAKTPVVAPFGRATEQVVRKIFRNEKVLIDGKSFYGCNFYAVTFVYEGRASYDLRSCVFHAPRIIEAGSPAVAGLGLLMYELGLLKDNSFLNEHGEPQARSTKDVTRRPIPEPGRGPQNQQDDKV